MLGDILCNQLLVTLLFTTFSFSDNHDIHGVYVVPSNKMSMLSRSVWFYDLSDQTERENMLIMLLETTRPHRIALMTIVMITERKCYDQVTDQELVAQNVTKHVMVATTV